VDLDGQALRLGDSKTGASIRPLARAAIEVLESLEKSSMWVLPGVRDVSGHYGSLNGAIERLALKAKIEGLTAHVLRHSFASVAGDLDYAEA
jgi:integrase